MAGFSELRSEMEALRAAFTTMPTLKASTKKTPTALPTQASGKGCPMHKPMRSMHSTGIVSRMGIPTHTSP